MANKARRHVHKYYRADLSFGKVWACALPDCTHYMPQHLEELVEGRKSICWQCDKQMILHPGNLNMGKPICDDCKLGIPDTPLSDKMAAFIAGKTKVD